MQEGENRLTPHDAYWLGLINEVLGDDDLVTLRSMVEHQPDPPDVPESAPAGDH
jgi:hypothetical protein